MRGVHARGPVGEMIFSWDGGNVAAHIPFFEISISSYMIRSTSVKRRFRMKTSRRVGATRHQSSAVVRKTSFSLLAIAWLPALFIAQAASQAQGNVPPKQPVHMQFTPGTLIRA